MRICSALGSKKLRNEVEKVGYEYVEEPVKNVFANQPCLCSVSYHIHETEVGHNAYTRLDDKVFLWARGR